MFKNSTVISGYAVDVASLSRSSGTVTPDIDFEKRCCSQRTARPLLPRLLPARHRCQVTCGCPTACGFGKRRYHAVQTLTLGLGIGKACEDQTQCGASQVDAVWERARDGSDHRNIKCLSSMEYGAYADSPRLLFSAHPPHAGLGKFPQAHQRWRKVNACRWLLLG